MSNWEKIMREALALAVLPDARCSPNPRVGCVLVGPGGEIVGRGHHVGAGLPHAEVNAIAAAGDLARGATAVVTLEPCLHIGRTGPCAQALIEAGVSQVIYAQADPTDLAGGGASVLARAGIAVIGGVLADEAALINRAWTHVQVTGRPFVSIKTAMSLDGRVAGAGGGPTAITGAAARAWVGQFRSEVDAVLIGANTAIIDNPALTARDSSGVLLPNQPLRVVVGGRNLPTDLKIFADTGAGPGIQIREHDPYRILEVLLSKQVHQVLIEGGPSIIAAFVESGLVDEIIWFVAPQFLGAGPVALAPLPSPQAVTVTAVEVIGNDVLIRGALSPAPSD
ncbi:MAG: bifunctional diaminohydroxyphosphoribosylaminopyrimidine deaminase/5-amino-6-(5-phosphoribosylamino)uracil reductase RibD [Actinobacteria bacterium]|nr:bifunctional diaminohydroxyphosphoribosylaminopyrimidine deaminase/5-amino-6-(5-phosphoribosylamino)uracil reductase RibD [Actinomycetota bacterium]